MKAVSIFTGAGGLDIGMERAGFETVSAVEIHPTFCATIFENQSKHIPIGDGRTYFQGTKVFQADIRTLSGRELMNGLSEVDCLIGGPPCQAFSSAGKQMSIFDERGSLIYEYLRILSEILPRMFLFENVRGLITARGVNNEPGEILSELLVKFQKLGYNCRVALLNSADYGSYQRRVRCFIIGSRIGEAPEFPPCTYGNIKSAGLFSGDVLKWLTLGDFLKLYQDKDEDNWIRPTEALLESLKDLPEGCGIKSPGRPEATRPNGHWGYRQGTFIADKSKPARTVTGSSSQDWIKLEDGTLRRLTFNEVKLLQGFPVEWTFCGSKANRFQQVGNAVPIVFGEIIGKVLMRYLLREEHGKSEVVLTKLPVSIENAIRYTKRDSQRNGAYRVRFKDNVL